MKKEMKADLKKLEKEKWVGAGADADLEKAIDTEFESFCSEKGININAYTGIDRDYRISFYDYNKKWKSSIHSSSLVNETFTVDNTIYYIIFK